MITNHGIHQWQVTPGLPDTGGQNIFVNQFSATLAQLGYKITIINRGGYTHPFSGERLQGIHYKDDQQRILYLDDGLHRFVRKEEMGAQLPFLATVLQDILANEGTEPDLIISHYWDGAVLGVFYNKSLRRRLPHFWIPHSLGAIKKKNVAAARWADLHIDERITTEKGVLVELDGVIATSSLIRQSLLEDYAYTGPVLFLPPCIDPKRFHPRTVPADDPVWSFVAERAGLDEEEVRKKDIVIEISRTDSSKRKDVLLRAFANASQQVPNCLLIVSIADDGTELAAKLYSLVTELALAGRVAIVGSVWELLPTLYAISSVYCTPSIMEGFGMSAQEAAATALPIISSPRVPFVSEYLMGEEDEAIVQGKLRIGRGAVIAPADDVEAFAEALTLLLTDANLRQRLAKNAYHSTIPAFTWQKRVKTLLAQMEVLV
ncbi:MAG: glycosyltransferase family 1 protein [Chloroflexi bacterium]|nr:glycosyltransferase family 1 protein [Chloroflexota bacterium]